MVDADIIATGSKGNAVVLNGWLLVDCGVPFKALKRVYRRLRLVLLTHVHGDHFHRPALAALAWQRPTLRFGCGPWLVPELARLVPHRQIDVLEPGRTYDYGSVKIEPVQLWHDVPNCGYKLFFAGGSVFYATDTSTLGEITAPGYDLYLIEANYDEAEMRERISEKKFAGEYAYERRVRETHLSKQQADAFIYRNIGPSGQYIYLHGHDTTPARPLSKDKIAVPGAVVEKTMKP